MFFLYTPQDPSPIYYDPEAAFREYQRREYIKQLREEEAQRVQFERELQLEQERHRAALEAIERKERLRRQREAQAAQIRAGLSGGYGRPQQQQPQYQQRPEYGQLPQRPSPQEVLARRLARQREEEQRSRQFHQDILSQIFGISPEELAYDEAEEEDYEAQPSQPIPASATRQPAPVEQPKPKPVRKYSQATQTPVTVHPPVATYTYALPAHQQTQPTRPSVPAATAESAPLPTAKTTEEKTQQPIDPVSVPDEDTILTDEPPMEIEDSDPHWSAAPERAKALAAISAVDRSFEALKTTFVFPSGHLERLPNSDIPRLAYNSTNAAIHAYEHALSELLGTLDGVESHGFKGVREARKQLIVKIEKELGDLDGKIAARLTGSDATTEETISIPIEVPSQGELPPSAAPVEVAPVKESEDVEMKDDAPKETPAPANVTAATPSLFKEDTPRNEPIDYPVITPSPAPATQPTTSSTEAPGAVPKDAMDIATETAVESIQQNKPEDATKVAESTTNPALVALPATTSDEEEEIADACLVGLSDDESDPKEKEKSAVGEFEMV